MAARFQQFDFTHPAFTDAQPVVKNLLLSAHNARWNSSRFIEAVLDAKIQTRGKRRHNRQYRNPHAIQDWYSRLDSKFNFFGNYEG